MRGGYAGESKERSVNNKPKKNKSRKEAEQGMV